MNRRFTFRFAAVIASLFLQLAVLKTQAGAEVDFDHEVVPVLKQHCSKCHIGDEPKGGFSLNDASEFRESLQSLDDPSELGSRMMELVRSEDPDDQMPPKEHARLSDDEQATLARWVTNKLPWTDGFGFLGNAYEPPVLPREVILPAALGGRTHPIDRILDQAVSVAGGSVPQSVDDYTFIRRASLDLVGMLPTADSVRAFVDDPSPGKRATLIDQLLSDETAYCEHWLTFWNDWLRNDYAGTGFITGGRKQISRWLYDSLINNKPYDVFARQLIAPTDSEAKGFADGIKWRGTVSAGQSLEIQYAQSVAQAFLGINMKCASCHDSFIDNWKLKDAYGLAAIYARTPLDIHRCDKPTGEVAQAAWLFPEVGEFNADGERDDRMSQLAALMTDQKNGRFARTVVNRLWAQLMGRGIVHPLAAMHTKPWNEDLLDFLANELVRNQYDIKQTLRLIATSQAYMSRPEVTAEEATTGESKDYVYQGPRSKRMTAEQFMDAVWTLTSTSPDRFDAPVVRGKFTNIDTSDISLSAKWIWKPLSNEEEIGTKQPDESKTPGEASTPDSKNPVAKNPVAKKKATETIVIRKVVTLPDNVLHGTAVITSDQGFELYIANREQARGRQGDDVTFVPVNSVLKKGPNQIVIIAHHDPTTANDNRPPGVFFEAHLTLSSKERFTIVSDETWGLLNGKPNVPKEGRLGKLTGGWGKTAVVSQPESINDVVTEQAKRELARADLASELPVRASLLKSDFLTRTLGRPNRDQIVTSRPADLTTVEAIELANNESLASMLKSGAKLLCEKHGSNAEQMIEHLFLSALSRPPTDIERKTLVAEFDANQPLASVEDWMWAVCMMPEFIMIR